MTRRSKVWMLPAVVVAGLVLASANSARAQGWSFQVGSGYFGGYPGGYHAYRPPVCAPHVVLPPVPHYHFRPPVYPRPSFGFGVGYGGGYPGGYSSFSYGYRPGFGGYPGYGGHHHGHGHCH